MQLRQYEAVHPTAVSENYFSSVMLIMFKESESCQFPSKQLQGPNKKLNMGETRRYGKVSVSYLAIILTGPFCENWSKLVIYSMCIWMDILC